METSRDDATFCGMERAFRIKSNPLMRHAEYFGIAKGEAIRHPWKEPQTTKENKKRGRSRGGNNRTWGRWASLPGELLFSMIMKLNILEYFAVGGVCRSWRSVAKGNRNDYMKRQKPLVVVKSSNAQRACFLFNIFDGEEYKAVLPDLRDKRFWGLSCGYVITFDVKSSEFWLINLMTRHELRFPVLPKDKKHITGFRAILFESTRHSRVSMIIFSRSVDFLLVSQNGAERWEVCSLLKVRIADVKVFKKKIYVLSAGAQIYDLDLSAAPVMKLHKGNISIQRPHCIVMHLVILDNQLCMRAVDGCENILYQLDSTQMVWLEIKEMGQYSLFLDRVNTTVVDASEWGAGNCICILNSRFNDSLTINRWSFHLLGHSERLVQVPVVWSDNTRLLPFFWYFPNGSYTIDCIDD